MARQRQHYRSQASTNPAKWSPPPEQPNGNASTEADGPAYLAQDIDMYSWNLTASEATTLTF